MSPDKALQIGNDLACLAASIVEIAEEIKAMYGFDQDRECDFGEPAPPAPDPRAIKPDQVKQPTLEQVRAVLAEKSRSGHTAEVRALLEKHGAKKLSDVDPAKYGALLADAEVLEDG